ncbi:hypothetical protein [Methylibium rhizosphaerae]|uniref:hypothetical protein n=1 Tax=Methylibium rhizosphaerae TaxID=2570323 RepID=UPI00112C7D7A|nr:hypothetical protein [Methylibium rhizosphaerae]
MIESLVQVAEKLVELGRRREQKREQRFNAVVKPMFEALHDVHKDYLDLLQEAKEAVTSDAALSEVLKTLKKRRLAEQGLRHDLLRQAHELLAVDALADCHDFLRQVSKYIGGTGFVIERTRSDGLFRTIAEAVLAAQSGGEQPSRQRLLRVVEYAFDELRSDWKNVSTSYAKALAATLS